MQADVCLASHRTDTRLSLTGIKQESCPHLPVVSHPTQKSERCTDAADRGGTGNVSEEKNSDKERKDDNGDDYQCRG